LLGVNCLIPALSSERFNLDSLKLVTPIKHRKIGAPQRELRAVASRNSSKDQLDLVHVTRVGAAREIVNAGQIETRKCKVFSKNLVYLFLARPAYRLKDGDQKSDQINRFPSVFIVSPENLGPPLHVYPFDTGAAVSWVFGDRADPDVFLEDYELEPTIGAAVGHMIWAFETAAAYFEGDLRLGLSEAFEPWQTVLRGFATIAGLASSTHNQPDRRASSIEIAYNNHIPLKGNAKLIIIPKQYLENGSSKNDLFLNRLKALNVDWDAYDWQPNLEPDFYLDEINQKVRSYLKKTGQI
jgi:hypothetical protein